MRRNKNERVLKGVHPNVGIGIAYRNHLLNLIYEMHNSTLYWLGATFKANNPLIAQDALPANELQRTMKQLADQWGNRFDDASKNMAAHFAKAAAARSDAAMRKILKDGGFSVKFRMSQAQRDVLQATVNENIGLIKSIPQKYMTDVQGAVMRSVQTGRDIGQLSKDLQKIKGVTKRRAEHIASDQNSKATASLTRARHVELGITEAFWRHSYGGKHPRPSHLAAGKRQQRYDTSKGWYDPDANGKGKGAYIFPGELISCRCVARAIIPGVTRT